MMNENVLQKQVAEYLKILQKKGKLFFFHPANNVKTNIRTASRLKADGVTAGVPDCIIYHKGKPYGIELKRPALRGYKNGKQCVLKPKGVLSPIQKITIPEMELHGVTIAIAYSLDDVILILKDWSIL